MRRILSLTCAAGLVALLAACSTLESNALSQEVGSGTSTPRATAPRLGPGCGRCPRW
jgi:outer membrane protein assembly factor BamE (lipoprotein component of BamABCDE complex)